MIKFKGTLLLRYCCFKPEQIRGIYEGVCLLSSFPYFKIGLAETFAYWYPVDQRGNYRTALLILQALLFAISSVSIRVLRGPSKVRKFAVWKAYYWASPPCIFTSFGCPGGHASLLLLLLLAEAFFSPPLELCTGLPTVPTDRKEMESGLHACSGQASGLRIPQGGTSSASQGATGSLCWCLPLVKTVEVLCGAQNWPHRKVIAFVRLGKTWVVFGMTCCKGPQQLVIQPQNDQA